MKIKLIRKLASGAIALTALFSSALVADTVTDAIRAQLAVGDYAAALKAGDVKGTALTDDVRVLRSYARLASAIETEGEAAAKRLGATQAKLDLFDTEASAVSVPQQIAWSDCRRATVKQLSRTRYLFTPQYFYNYPEIRNFGGIPYNLNEVDPDILKGSLIVSFLNNSASTKSIKLSLNLGSNYEESGNENWFFYINGKIFSRKQLLTQTASFPEWLANNVYFSSGTNISIEPGAVLSVVYRPNSYGSLEVSVPTGVAVYNGKYPSAFRFKLASTATSTELFTTMGNLTKNAIDASITDLASVKTGHRLTLSAEESISCISTIIEDADRKAWVATLKLLKATGQFNTAYNLAVPVGGIQLFDGSLNLLKVINQNPNLLKLGTMPATNRTALLTLLTEALDQLDQAAALGLVARDRQTAADYLFNKLDADDYIKFATPTAKSFSMSNSVSKNNLLIKNTSETEQSLTFTLNVPETYNDLSGYLATTTTYTGTGESTQNSLWFGLHTNATNYEERRLRVIGFSHNDTLSWESEGLRITVPAHAIVTLGAGEPWKSYLYIDTGEQHNVGTLTLTLNGNLPSGVKLSATALQTDTQRLKDWLAQARLALSAAGTPINEPFLGAKVALAPLFAAKPVVLRDQLPTLVETDGKIRVKPNTSTNLVTKSGLLLGVPISNWEDFIQ